MLMKFCLQALKEICTVELSHGLTDHGLTTYYLTYFGILLKYRVVLLKKKIAIAIVSGLCYCIRGMCY